MISTYGYLAAWPLLQSVSWFWNPGLHPVLEFLNNLWGLGLETEALRPWNKWVYFASKFGFCVYILQKWRPFWLSDRRRTNASRTRARTREPALISSTTTSAIVPLALQVRTFFVKWRRHRVGRVLSFFSSRRRWDSHTPSSPHPSSPHLWIRGAHSLAGEGVGGPNSDEGTYS